MNNLHTIFQNWKEFFSNKSNIIAILFAIIGLGLSFLAFSQSAKSSSGNFSFPNVISDTTETIEDEPEENIDEEDDREFLPLEPNINTRSRGEIPKDSSHATEWVDSTAYIFIDSTSRVEHFLHQRNELIYANPFVKSPHPLYLENRSTAYQLNVTLDSTGYFVDVTEKIYDKDVKIPIRLTLEDYIHKRLEFDRYKSWAALAQVYVSEQKDLGLSEFFGSITNIEIPMPAVGFLSIFGPPIINLRISGAVDIKAGFRSQKSDQTSLSERDQVRNEPNFNQEVQINVNGTIGDKLNILADWNTQRTFEYENQLKLKYTGYEDEIIQSIEAGNVSLQTGGSYIGSSQALFGIKGRFQLGPLSLQTVVSQKKGQTKELTASGGAQEKTFEIRAFDYSTNHYFFDTVYRNIFETLFASLDNQLPFTMLQYQIVEIEIWKTKQGSIFQTGQKEAVALIDLPPISPNQTYPDSTRNLSSVSGKIERGTWIKLQPNEYKYNPVAGYISIATSLQNDQALAVAFRTQGATGSLDDDMIFGEFAGSDTSNRPMILKLIRPKNLIPSFKPAWDLMLKNIYSLGGSNLKKEGFELKIYRESGGQADLDELYGTPLLQILKLDRLGENNSQQPDGFIDFNNRTVDQPRAEIIFPSLEPFRKSIREFLISKNESDAVIDSLTFPEIYDTLTYIAKQSRGNRYVLKGKSSTGGQSKYSLGFNIVEGSVQVLLDGSPLSPNVDYTVDYMIGEVIIRSARALVPNANLQIKYEQNDLFQLASKTLIGLRGEMDPLPNTKLGFTWMNLNQETLSDKVRLNEEPTNNSIFGVDATTSLNLGFLTTAIDALPFIKTKEMSSIKISGEAAYMLPDPNTKKSSIASDKGSGIAFIDDFEGARRTIPLGVGYSTWRLSSPPAYTLLGNIQDSLKTFSKGKLWWYNRLPSDVFINDIWPKKSVRQGQEQVTVLNLDYFPKERGPFNYSLDIESTLLSEPNKNWAGVMKFLGGTGSNIIEQNINYIELWIKAENMPSHAAANLLRGRLYLNIGKVSEDVIPNKKLNSEDLVKTVNPNGVLNEGEDTGLDMLTDAEERIVYAALVNKYPELSSDPSGDNWAFSTGGKDFSRINGTERSASSPEGRFPDNEDLNTNGSIDLIDSYLEYEVPLDTVYTDSLGFERQNEYIVGGGSSGWYQIRIPLTNFTRKIASGAESPTDILQNVQFVRMWISGFDEPVRIRIADISLTGNQWQEVNRTDTVLRVSVVNIEDNPEYERPPGVIRERDRTQPDQEIFGNEQSLTLQIRGLVDGQSREAFKYYAYKPLDVFNYRTMKMFVHGGRTFNFRGLDDYDADVYLRFGFDSLNYYEYRAPLHQGWDPINNEVIIKFSDLTSIKEGRDSVRGRSTPVPVPGGPPGSYYVVRGTPALTNIRYIWVGVENPVDKGKSIVSGDIWFNELRVSDVDDTPGWAYRFDTQIKIADFGNASFNYSKMDPYFHGLDQRFGSRTSSVNWAASANFALERFLPSSWQGTSLPFSYSHTENVVNPQYFPNTDIRVDEAADRVRQTMLNEGHSSERADSAKNSILNEAQTLRISDSYTIPNLRIVIPSSAWYINETFNKLAWRFNYTKSMERNPTIAERISWAWNGGGNYAVAIPPNFYFSPFIKLFAGVWLLDDFKDYKVFYIPIVSFNTGFSVQRGQSYEIARVQSVQRPVTRNFNASRSLAFGWKLTEGGLSSLSGDYSLNIESVLLHLETDSAGNQRRFSEILRDIFRTNKIIDFGRDARYGQRFSINTKPKLPNLLDINKYLDFTLGYSVNYGWQTNFLPGDAGKSSGWDNNITFSSNFKLKALTDPWFAFIDAPGTPQAKLPPPRIRQREQIDDSTAVKDTTAVEKPTDQPTGPNKILSQLKNLSKIFIKYPLLDYETINITFTQTNRSTNSGVRGSTGFMNFWGIPPFQDPNPEYGPSRLYQLGIVTDPSGRLEIERTTGFPFIKFNAIKGLRASNAQLTDQFTHTNRISLRTSRPLWEGASLDLTWNLSWAFNKSTTLSTDADGVPSVSSMAISGNVDRSFFTLPPVLLFKMLKSNLEEVGKKYNARRIDITDKASDDVKLAESFEEGMEALPLLQKVLGPLVPRANYSFRWDGLEKTLGIGDYIDRLSFDHVYTSNFAKQWRGNPAGGIRTEAERIGYGFAPLIGLNATMKELLKGNVTTTLRYNTTSSYDLNIAARNIASTLTQELSFSMNYNRRGFEFPLFGLSLSNDIDLSMSYSMSHNSRTTYEVNQLETNPDGTPLEGTTRTMFEPRLRYVLSSRITASVFYRYTKIAPDEGGSLIPGNTTNEGGLDIRIAIQ